MNFRWPQMVATPLRQIIPNAGTDGLNIMRDMMLWDPQKRPTAQQVNYISVKQNIRFYLSRSWSKKLESYIYCDLIKILNISKSVAGFTSQLLQGWSESWCKDLSTQHSKSPRDQKYIDESIKSTNIWLLTLYRFTGSINTAGTITTQEKSRLSWTFQMSFIYKSIE